jgi:hypothetical protein
LVFIVKKIGTYELLITREELKRFFADEKKPANQKGVTGQWKLN